MMVLSVLATLALIGALFWHRVSLRLSSVILLLWTAAMALFDLWTPRCCCRWR